MVKFLNGEERIIDYHVWEYYENDCKIMDVIQIPIKLAYAISSHKCCSENTLIYTSNGLKRISKISSDLITNQKLLSTKEIDIDIIGKTGLQKATQIYKGEVEDTIKITTSLGYTLEGSIRHPLLTYNGAELWKKIPELNINDFLVLKNDLQSFGKNVDTSSFRSNNFNVKYTIPKVVDEKLCYLIGLLIGDGCYSVKTDYPIELTISKEINEIKDTYLEYFNYIFGKHCKVYTPKNRTTYKLSINSKQVREFLLWCGLDYVIAENKTIPWVVFENTKEAQIACIKGLFDSDGGVNDKCIHYTTISYQLSVDIQNMLLNIGIISSRQEMNGESRKKYKQAYRVHISGYNAHLFYKFVGFVDKNKQKKLENKYGRYELNVIKTNVCKIPDGNNLIKKLRDEIYSHHKNTMRCNILTSHTSKLFSKIIANKTSLRYFHVKHICEEFKDIDKFGESGKKIKYINDNNLFFDTIKTIENSNCQLYDLYVPKDNTFIGNGIINHNSQGTSLDFAEIDLSEVFCYGQAYIMLSRVKKIEGLSIKKLDIKKITAHPKAVEYYKNLEKM
jgi:intein/homing endonuclease